MASGDLPDQTGQSIEACFANARDTLRAAKRVLEDENLPNISFHLTVLALEEIGKAALLGIWHIARSTGGESNSIEKRLDDHQFKLFWALWAPNLARGKVSKKEIEELRGLAKNLHEDRLDAMYVSIEPMEGGAPLQRLTQERAGALLKLAEARLGMELSRGWQPVDVNAHAEMRWFLEATADPEKRKLIFGQKAFEKLAELGQMRDWMIWLKDQFDKAEAEGCENLRRELARAAPGVDNPGQNKWQIVVRLFSPSHSIRNHAINSWNSRPSWIRLAPVGNNSHAVDVEFSYREVVPLQALGPLSYSAARIFVASLNIGSLGFWWWHLPNQSGRFHERLTDLNAPSGMRIDLNMHSGPEVEWKREALNDDVLCRIALCLGMISALEPLPYQSIIEPYLTGVALIAKSDLHLNFPHQASERFGTCLLQAMRHFGDWDGSDDGMPAGVTGFFGSRMQKAEDVQELLDLLRQLRRRPPDGAGVTLERAAVLKLLCDAYLNTRLQMMAGDGMIRNESGKAPSRS